MALIKIPILSKRLTNEIIKCSEKLSYIVCRGFQQLGQRWRGNKITILAEHYSLKLSQLQKSKFMK